MSNAGRISKRTRTLILAAIAVVVLGGLLAVLLLLPSGEEGASSTASSDPSVTVLDKSKDAEGNLVDNPVKALTIQLKEEEITFSMVDDELVADKYKDLPVNTYNIGSLADDVASITAARKVESQEDPAAFGFDEPLARVKATYHDNSTYEFEIGDETPYQDGYYFRGAGGSEIYIVDTTMGEMITQPSTAYIGTTLITAPTVKEDDENGQAVLRDMALSGSVRETAFSFQRVTSEDSEQFAYSTYKITTPYLRGVDSNMAQTLETYTSLSATEAVVAHPTKENLTKYGFDTPYSVAKLNVAVTTEVEDTETSSNTTSSGTEEAATKTSYYNVTPHTLTVGSKDEDGNYYLMADDIDVIYRVSASSLSAWVELQYDDVADKMLFMTDITTVGSMAWTIDGQETVFELTHHPEEEDRDKNLTVKVGDQTLSTPDFRSLYQIMMGVQRNSAADSKPTGTPDVTFRLTLLDESEPFVSASFYHTSASLYTCVLSTGECYQVKASDINTLKTQMDNYLNGKEVHAD